MCAFQVSLVGDRHLTAFPRKKTIWSELVTLLRSSPLALGQSNFSSAAFGKGHRALQSFELMMSTNSGLSEAPPTRKPRMEGLLASSLQFLPATEPP